MIGFLMPLVAIVSGVKHGSRRAKDKNISKENAISNGSRVCNCWGKKGYGAYDVYTGHKLSCTSKGWVDLETGELVEKIIRGKTTDEIRHNIWEKDQNRNSLNREEAIKKGKMIYEANELNISYKLINEIKDIPLDVFYSFGKKGEGDYKAIYLDTKFKFIMHFDNGIDNLLTDPCKRRLGLSTNKSLKDAIHQYNKRHYDVFKNAYSIGKDSEYFNFIVKHMI